MCITSDNTKIVHIYVRIKPFYHREHLGLQSGYLLVLYRYRVHVDGHYTAHLPSYPALQIIDYIVQLDHISVLRHLCMKRYYPVSRSIIMHHKVMHTEYVFVKVQYHLLESIDKLRLRLCSKQRVYRLSG